MDDRRKTLGRRIKRARQRAGYGSQRAFAKAIGVDTTSVAKAESGDAAIAIGGRVFAAIEDGLKWPEDCTARYLETGDESVFTALVDTAPRDDAFNPVALRAEVQTRLDNVRRHYPEEYEMLMSLLPEGEIGDADVDRIVRYLREKSTESSSTD
jgi:transcriptional regulator with XRE-family HTH domain